MSRLMLCRLFAGKFIVAGPRPGVTWSHQQMAGLYQLANTNHLFGSGNNIVTANSRRQIYSETSLRLDTFDLLRQDKSRIFESGRERYIERVRKYIEQGEVQSVVKEDLVNIIGLAETEEHLDLIEHMISAPSMKQLMDEGPWGSVVARLYYRMSQPDRALKNLKDTERFGQFFMQYAAFRTIMTLLYNAERYDDVLELHTFAATQLNLNNFTRQRQLDVLALAACARKKTSDAYSIAEAIHTKSSAYDNRHLRSRMDSLMAHMAIEMNEPAKALNILTGQRTKSSFSLPAISLKSVALVKLNRYEDVVFHLREALQSGVSMQKAMPQDVVEMLREKKDHIEDENVRQELMDILVECQDNNLVDSRPLETIIFNTIDTREGGQFPAKNADGSFSPRGGDRGNFSQQDRYTNDRYNRGGSFERGDRRSFDRGDGRQGDRYGGRRFDRRERTDRFDRFEENRGEGEESNPDQQGRQRHRRSMRAADFDE